MKPILQPTFRFNHYREITPEWLQKERIKFILSDLDSTLAPHDEEEEEEFIHWYQSIEAVGTGLIIVSNNNHERVERFIHKHSLVGIARCRKPSTRKIMEELFHKGLSFDTTLFLGDQLFTDIWCGKRLGIKTALVKPLPGKETFGIRLKRYIETIIRVSWRKEKE